MNKTESVVMLVN